MNPLAVLKKTPAGAAALHDRSVPMTAQMRGLLVIADGVKTVADMARFGAAFGDVPALAEKLVAAGLIEVIHFAQAPLQAPAQFTAAPQPAAPAQHLAQWVGADRAAVFSPAQLQTLQRAVCRCLSEGLGPASEGLCIRIEKAKTVAGILPLAEQGLAILNQSRRSEMAARLDALIASMT